MKAMILSLFCQANLSVFELCHVNDLSNFSPVLFFDSLRLFVEDINDFVNFPRSVLRLF